MNIYQKVIYDMIDFKEEVYQKFKNLINSSNSDISFSENGDGSISCQVKYKGYDVSICITEKEVFQYALKSGKEPSDAIKEVIQNKLFDELSDNTK